MTEFLLKLRKLSSTDLDNFILAKEKHPDFEGKCSTQKMLSPLEKLYKAFEVLDNIKFIFRILPGLFLPLVHLLEQKLSNLNSFNFT